MKFKTQYPPNPVGQDGGAQAPPSFSPVPEGLDIAPDAWAGKPELAASKEPLGPTVATKAIRLEPRGAQPLF